MLYCLQLSAESDIFFLQVYFRNVGKFSSRMWILRIAAHWSLSRESSTTNISGTRKGSQLVNHGSICFFDDQNTVWFIGLGVEEKQSKIGNWICQSIQNNAKTELNTKICSSFDENQYHTHIKLSINFRSLRWSNRRTEASAMNVNNSRQFIRLKAETREAITKIEPNKTKAFFWEFYQV